MQLKGGDWKERCERQAQWAESVAHDLRQPASVVRLAAEMLKRERSALRRERLLDSLIANAELLERLTRDLSEALATDRQPFDVHLAPSDVGHVVRDIVARQATVLSIPDPQIHISPGHLAGHVDAQRIEQVLANVLRNARDHGTPGGRIEVSVTRSYGEIRVDVTNEGEGPPMEERTRVFEPYVRLDPKRPGTGLGLHVSRSIVEMHGGRMWMEVEAGRTRVSFTIPSTSEETPRRRPTSRPSV